MEGLEDEGQMEHRFRKCLLCACGLGCVFLVLFGAWSYWKKSSRASRNLKIDMVYLWCDGNAHAFREKKRMAEEKAKDIGMKEVNFTKIFREHDELKFSLRSLEKYAPWINHIFIVTNGKMPRWLNVNHKKITILDQDEILPLEAQPSFNSCVIESHLDKIPNLSEHFLYANDDMFFGSEVSPEFFFDEENNPIVRCVEIPQKDPKCIEKILKNKTWNLYNQTVFYSIMLTYNKFGIFFKWFPHHNIDAYRKSYVKEAFLTFKKEHDQLNRCPFRKENTLQRVIIHCNDYVKKRALIKPSATISYFSVTVFNSKRGEQTEEIKYAIKHNKFALFCINDSAEATKKDRAGAKRFLEEVFPEKSSFER
ncbi:MAG: hypothetical protein LBB63_00810 [Holosporaceae bacterium]|nr:hypothetical protein [Holosporaceae bacterium]